MEILLGTTNPSKVGYFESILQETGLTFVTLRDLGVTDEPEECGASPEENARIKAEFYYRYAPEEAVICVDSGLYFDTLPLDDPRQPGLHVRTPGGRPRLDDEAMIAYYAALSHELGGRVLSYYLDGAAVRCGRRMYSFQESREQARKSGFYLMDTPCEARRPGWPLDSLSVAMDGCHYLSPERKTQVQQGNGYKQRLRAFVLGALGIKA